jgi:hypothetical protein
MNIVAIKPAYDFETRILQSFFNDVTIKIAEKKQTNEINFINLDSEKATYDNIIQEINRLNGARNNIICFYGHGTKSYLLGWNKEPLFKNNHEIIKGWHFYTVACSSILKLGIQSVDNGVLSYIGYKDKFVIGVNNRVIKGLKDIVNCGILSSIDSFSYNVVNIYNDMIQKYIFWIGYHSELIEFAYDKVNNNGSFNVIIKEKSNVESCSISKLILMYNKYILDYKSKTE